MYNMKVFIRKGEMSFVFLLHVQYTDTKQYIV